MSPRGESNFFFVRVCSELIAVSAAMAMHTKAGRFVREVPSDTDASEDDTTASAADAAAEDDESAEEGDEGDSLMAAAITQVSPLQISRRRAMQGHFRALDRAVLLCAPALHTRHARTLHKNVALPLTHPTRYMTLPSRLLYAGVSIRQDSAQPSWVWSTACSTGRGVFTTASSLSTAFTTCTLTLSDICWTRC